MYMCMYYYISEKVDMEIYNKYIITGEALSLCSILLYIFDNKISLNKKKYFFFVINVADPYSLLFMY